MSIYTWRSLLCIRILSHSCRLICFPDARKPDERRMGTQAATLPEVLNIATTGYAARCLARAHTKAPPCIAERLTTLAPGGGVPAVV